MKTDILIIGGGITGLSCAYYLKKDYDILEKESVPGGVCQTDKIRGFLFDRAEHFIRIPNERVLSFFRKILGNSLFSQKLISSIYYDKRFVPYPFQKNIYYLSDKHKLGCLKSFLRRKKYANNKKVLSLGSWALSTYGDWMSDTFIVPYNKKIWQTSPFKMRSDFSFDPRIIPEISLDEMLECIFLEEDQRRQSNSQLRYYLREGGIGSFSDKLASRTRNIKFNKKVISIDLKKKRAVCSDGTVCSYNKLISTMPLPELAKITKGMPTSLKNKAGLLKYNSICVFNFALNRNIKLPQHWIYFPEPEAPFARVYFLKNFNSKMCPKNKSSISVIYVFMPDKKIDFSKLEKNIVEYLIKHNFLFANDIKFKYRQIIKYGMPIPIMGSDKIVEKLDRFLSANSVKTLGRYGLWKYEGIEHAVEYGQNIDSILKGVRS